MPALPPVSAAGILASSTHSSRCTRRLQTHVGGGGGACRLQLASSGLRRPGTTLGDGVLHSGEGVASDRGSGLLPDGCRFDICSLRCGLFGGEFLLGQLLGGDANVVLHGQIGETLAVGTQLAALAIALELVATEGGGIGAQGIRDLADFDHLRSDGVVGANDQVRTVPTVLGAVATRGWHGGEIGELSRPGAMCRDKGVLRLVAPLLAQDDTLREGDFWWGVDVEVLREAVFGGNVNCDGVAGVGDAGRPLVARQQELGGCAQGGEEKVGSLEVDHVGGDGLDQLVEGRLHGKHVFEGRELEVKALVAGAGLGHAQETGAVAQMIGAVVAAMSGGGVASAAVVVGVSAGCECGVHVCFALPVGSASCSWVPTGDSAPISTVGRTEKESQREYGAATLRR